MLNDNIDTNSIRKLVADDQIEEALIILNSSFAETEFVQEIILQTSRYSALLKSDRSGVISYTESSIEKNKIVKAIVQLLYEIENYDQFEYRKKSLGSLYRSNKIVMFVSIFIFATLLVYFFYQKHMQSEVENKINELDQEIAERIRNVDVLNWYRTNISSDTVVSLPSRFFSPPNRSRVINTKFEDRNIKSLILELHSLLNEINEENNLKLIEQKFIEFENKYLDVNFSSDMALPFYIELISINEMRWYEVNKIDRSRLNKIGKQLIEISMENN